MSAGEFGFVAAAQIARVRRHRLSKKTGRTKTETAYLVTSLWPGQTTPQQVLAGNRRHWGIENGNHYRRDVTFDEDRCRIRHPVGARVMAALRCLAISLYLWAARRDPKGTPESLRLWLRGNRQTIDTTIALLDLGS